MLRPLLSLIILLSLATHCLAVEITFRSEVTVTSADVTLGDIADFTNTDATTEALATQVVAKAPAPGTSFHILSQNVKQSLQKNLALPDSYVWTGAETISVQRQGIEINHQQIKLAISQFIQNNIQNLPPAEYRFIPSSLPMPFYLPAGEISIEVVPSTPNIIGSKRFSLIHRVNNKVESNISIRGHLEAIAPVVVAAVRLNQGDIITPETITMVKKDLSNLREPCLTSRDILGKKLKRSMKPGKVIRLSQVDFPPVIKRGQLVKIFARKPGILITATGVARMNGKQNEIIRVRNTSSNKIIFCRIIRPGIVEVQI